MAVLKKVWRPGELTTDTEKLLLECVAEGQVFDGAGVSSAIAPSGGGTGQHDAVVRAEILRYLLTTDDRVVDPKGVRLHRVRVAGLLDLEAVTAHVPLVLTACDLDDSHPVVANFATMPLLILRDCRLAGFLGDSLKTEGNLSFRGSHFDGPVNLSGARIGGALLCRGAQVAASEWGNSLSAHGMNVRLSVHLSNGFSCEGAVVMLRAAIGGELLFQEASIGANKNGMSLEAAGITVGGALLLSEGFNARGAVSLAGARIGGQISCNGARLGADEGGNSLHCDGLRAAGSMNLDRSRSGDAFSASGAIRLAGAEIAGSFTCRSAQLGANGHGNALIADELKTGVAVLLEAGFVASGAVRLPGAEITGQFRCQDAQIAGVDRESCSLVCSGFKVGGPAYFDSGFKAAGAIVLSGADFGGSVQLSSADLGADLSLDPPCK